LKLVEISRERRRFTAHATLARYRDGARYLGDAEPLAEELLPGPAFQVASFELIQSKLGPNGSTYETAEKFLSL
jgi:2'-5' RNA ligase